MAWSFTGSPAAAGKQGGNTLDMFRKPIRIGRHGIQPQKLAQIGKVALTLMPNGNIFYGNQRVGYLDEADVLFGMNRRGYAVQIGPSDRWTACDMLREWLNETDS